MSSPSEIIDMELESLEVTTMEIESSDKNAPYPHQGIASVLLSEGRARFFNSQTLNALSKTCASWSQEARPALTERAAKVAMQHIVYGEQEEAEAMIKANPELLLYKSQVKDYSGRTIIATPFQAALGAEDEWMWGMMRPYFTILESKGAIDSAKEEVRQQFDEQFPGGIENIPAKELQAMYDDLASAIINNDDNGKEEIEGFRQIITQHDCIDSGIHFNMQHLIAAYQAYIDNFGRLGTCVNRDTFWNKVIGFVQRQMPTNYAQVHCSGIKNVIDSSDNFKRKLSFNDGVKFFPLPVDAAGLGFDFAVYSFRSACCCRGVAQAGAGAAVARWLLKDSWATLFNYFEQKPHHLSVLSQSLNQHPKSLVTR